MFSGDCRFLCMAIQLVPTNKLYHGYKEELHNMYEKYFLHDGNPLLWKNTPICRFAMDYVKIGNKVLDEDFLNKSPFILFEYERYFDADSVKNDTHKYNAAKRLMKVVDSVKKHGYAEGKFDRSRHLIRVKKGFASPYGDDSDGFTLVARKHKTSAAVALGMKKMRAQY
tara:strand:- start:2398 stop:2904 length:507 start_codon:yes stop_codon:yes gene_type:complete